MSNTPLALLFLALAGYALAAIGPVTNLNVVNANISPDGFNRSSVSQSQMYIFQHLISSSGRCLQKVFSPDLWSAAIKWVNRVFTSVQIAKYTFQGDNFQIKVIDSLTDNTMLRSTSIVSYDLDMSHPVLILIIFP